MPRAKYTSSFKVKSVLDAIKYPDGIMAYCRRHGLYDVLIYKWQSQMIANAEALFSKPSPSAEAKVKRLEQDLQRKDQIIAALVDEALVTKKKFMI
jgi:transposase-like protein